MGHGIVSEMDRLKNRRSLQLSFFVLMEAIIVRLKVNFNTRFREKNYKQRR